MRHLAALLVVLVTGGISTAAESPQPGSPNTDKAANSLAAKVIGEGGAVCDEAWLTDASGGTTLIVTVDYTGRRFCNEVLRIRPEPQPVVLQRLRVWNAQMADELLRDLDGDGTRELVLFNLLTPYNGARCVAGVPYVYRCTRNHCYDATRQFRQFLGEQLALLREPRKDMSQEEYEDQMSCYVVQRDALHRLSGADPKAGLQTARQWLNTDNADLRAKGLHVLLNIDDEEARNIVRELVNDRDRSIAAAAVLAVKNYSVPQ